MFEKLKQQIQKDIEKRNDKFKINKCLYQKIETAIMCRVDKVKEIDE